MPGGKEQEDSSHTGGDSNHHQLGHIGHDCVFYLLYLRGGPIVGNDFGGRATGRRAEHQRQPTDEESGLFFQFYYIFDLYAVMSKNKIIRIK